MQVVAGYTLESARAGAGGVARGSEEAAQGRSSRGSGAQGPRKRDGSRRESGNNRWRGTLARVCTCVYSLLAGEKERNSDERTAARAVIQAEGREEARSGGGEGERGGEGEGRKGRGKEKEARETETRIERVDKQQEHKGEKQRGQRPSCSANVP